MKWLKLFEDFEEIQGKKKILIIIDVQKSFRQYFTEMYLYKLKKYLQSLTSFLSFF